MEYPKFFMEEAFTTKGTKKTAPIKIFSLNSLSFVFFVVEKQ